MNAMGNAQNRTLPQKLKRLMEPTSLLLYINLISSGAGLQACSYRTSAAEAELSAG